MPNVYLIYVICVVGARKPRLKKPKAKDLQTTLAAAVITSEEAARAVVTRHIADTEHERPSKRARTAAGSSVQRHAASSSGTHNAAPLTRAQMRNRRQTRSMSLGGKFLCLK